MLRPVWQYLIGTLCNLAFLLVCFFAISVVIALPFHLYDPDRFVLLANLLRVIKFEQWHELGIIITLQMAIYRYLNVYCEFDWGRIHRLPVKDYFDWRWAVQMFATMMIIVCVLLLVFEGFLAAIDFMVSVYFFTIAGRIIKQFMHNELERTKTAKTILLMTGAILMGGWATVEASLGFKGLVVESWVMALVIGLGFGFFQGIKGLK